MLLAHDISCPLFQVAAAAFPAGAGGGGGAAVFLAAVAAFPAGAVLSHPISLGSRRRS